jgi:Fic family protein
MKFAKLYELKSELSAKKPLNDGELRRLREEFAIENTYNSNAIEGNTLTLRETALIIEKGITIGEKPIREHLEAIGHKNAFEFIIGLSDKSEKLSERVIKEIHSLVLLNDRENSGVYRKIPVKISGALHTPADPLFIEEQIRDLLLSYEESDAEPIEKIAEFHLRFEGIHPFIDGNGRTGRLIMNLELMKNGWLPVNIKFTDRRKYYDTFDDYYGQGKNTLTDLIIHYEEDELQSFINKIT